MPDYYLKLYKTRFGSFERIRKEKLWKVFCSSFLQRFINENRDIVLDIGAGSCEFINNIKAKKKIAFDGNKEIKKLANSETKTIVGNISQVRKKIRKKVDIIFISNLLEHLESKEIAFKFLYDLRFILKKEGRIFIMQPDISKVGNSYWDFFDHKIPITEKGLIEALSALDFKIIYKLSPFLPYSTKTKLPLKPFFLKIYLKFRPFHFLFGKQFFLIAQKN